MSQPPIPAPCPSQPVVSQRVLDPEALAAAVRDAHFVPCQLSAKPSPSMVARVICPRVCLDLASLGPAMLFTGSMPRDCYTMVFVVDCPGKGRSFNFAVEHEDGRAAHSAPGTVKQAAFDWGFWHMGHFAREYRQFFGESPSATMPRRARF